MGWTGAGSEDGHLLGSLDINGQPLPMTSTEDGLQIPVRVKDDSITVEAARPTVVRSIALPWLVGLLGSAVIET